MFPLFSNTGQSVDSIEPREAGGAQLHRLRVTPSAFEEVRVSQQSEAIAVVRRNVEEVQSKGDFALFDRLFAEDYVDHTPQPGFPPTKDGTRALYGALRAAFPDFRVEIHFQFSDGDRVAIYKTYRGTQDGPFMGRQPSGKRVCFDSVDVMRVRDGQIVAHWGVGDLLGLLQQLRIVQPLTLDMPRAPETLPSEAKR